MNEYGFKSLSYFCEHTGYTGRVELRLTSHTLRALTLVHADLNT